MDEATLKAIEERAAAATPGPWEPKLMKAVHANGEATHDVRSAADGTTAASMRFRPLGAEIGEDQADRDCFFIAAARSDVPALVAELKRLLASIAEAEAQVTREYGEAAGRRLRELLR